MHRRKGFIITLFVIFTLLISSCNNQNDSNSDVVITTKSHLNIEAEFVSDDNIESKQLLGDIRDSESDSDDNMQSEPSEDDKNISVSVFGGETLLIDKDRFNDDIYGTGQLDNRWSLKEIDVILNSIKGDWKLEEYIGFVDFSIYYPDLFDQNDNIEENVRNNLMKDYNDKVESAKINIPNISFSVKSHDAQDSISNYIEVNESYLSPISIILSLDRMNDYYPVFVDRTTISMDFTVEYPVIYIKFFIKYNEGGLEARYEPATLVLTEDNKFYILIDGAFYSVVRK